ncbi:MAG: hypothetical protein WDW38_009173 [Sanguina aurantia]
MSMAHLKRLESYLGLLSKLNAKGDPIPDHPFLWNSPMAGKPASFFKCVGLKQEEVMVAPAAKLGEAASHNLGVEDSSRSRSKPLPKLLRRPLSSPHSAPAPALMTSQGLPAELLSGMSLCLQSACQAEAQAITAHRAGQRRTSPATTAALHEGAAELFDEAARALKNNTGESESASAAKKSMIISQFNTVSDRLRRYLALSSSLQHEASHICDSCVSVAGSDPLWRALLAQHLGALDAFRLACERDRVNITYQTVSRTTPAMVGPKILATPIPYIPTPTESAALG